MTTDVGVERGHQVGQAPPQPGPGGLQPGPGGGIARGGGRRQVLPPGRRPRRGPGDRPPRVGGGQFGGVPAQGGAGDQGLPAAPPPASAERPGGIQRQVPQLPQEAAAPLDTAPDHQAPADAGAQAHEQHHPVPGPGPETGLRQGGQVGVVVHHNGHAGGGRHFGSQSHPAPGGVRAPDQGAGGMVHQPCRPDPDGADPRDEQRGDRFDDGLPGWRPRRAASAASRQARPARPARSARRPGWCHHSRRRSPPSPPPPPARPQPAEPNSAMPPALRSRHRLPAPRATPPTPRCR